MSEITYIFWTLMIGFMCGAIAKLLSPKFKKGDIFTPMGLGLLGSVILGYVGSLTHLYHFGHPFGLFASLLGAVLFLIVYHFVPKPTV